MINNDQNSVLIPGEKFYEFIHYEHCIKIPLMCGLEEKKWVAFGDLKELIIWPEEELLDVLDVLIAHGFVSKADDKFSLTTLGTACLLTLRCLNSEIDKMLKEGIPPEEMARMAKLGLLHKLLAQRAESNNKE